MLRDIERAIWIAGLAAQAVILYRLVTLGLWRRYWIFSLWLAVAVVRALALQPFDLNSVEYARVWLFTRPPTWILTIFAVTEVSTAALRNFSGISTFARRFNMWATGIAVVIAWATVGSTWGEPAYPYRVAFRIGQVVQLSATVFLLLLMVLLRMFPMPVSKNLVRHATLFGVLMISQSILVFYEMLSPKLVTRELSLANQALVAVVFTIWAFAWSREGEAMEPARTADPAKERNLLDNLAAINSALARTTPNKPPA